MSTIGQIEKGISTWKAKVETLQAESAKGAESLAATKKLRETLALAAHSGDAEAKESLRRAHGEQRDLELTLEDIESALGEARRNLAELKDQHDGAVRADMARQYDDEAAALIADSNEIEKGLTLLVASIDTAKTRIAKMDRLATAAGIEPRHKNCLKNLRHATEQRMGLDAVYLHRQYREFFRGPVPKIFEHSLGGEVVDEAHEANDLAVSQ